MIDNKKGFCTDVIRAYSTVSLSADDDKPRLLLKTLRLILDKLEIVRTAVEQRNYYKKNQELSKIATAIELLDASLDMSYGELPNNLSRVYKYLLMNLKKNHVNCDTRIVDECKTILAKIYEGFSSVYENERKKQAEKTDKKPKTGMNEYA